MEGWGKIWVQSASVLYPNSCYNESCYIEVQVYLAYSNDVPIILGHFYSGEQFRDSWPSCHDPCICRMILTTQCTKS